MDKLFNRLLYNLSVTIFGILTLTFLISSLGFIFHIPINIFDLLIPFGLGVFYLFKNSDTKKEFFIQLILLFVIIAISYGISLTFWDDTWDGRSYHAATIIMLKNGWLPLYDNISEITQKLSLYPFNTQFSDCYLKFSEIVGANIYNLTGHIESPKTSNLLFVGSLFMYSSSVFKEIIKKNTISVILAVSICLNLVCITQLLTNYVDIQIYIAITFFILTVLKIEKTHIQTRADIFLIIMSSLMLATVKLTGIAYFAVIYFCWFIYRIISKNEVKSIIITSIVSFLLILITSINPFYTNLKNYGHPFHPFMGKNKMNLTPQQYPVGFKNKTPLQRFLISTFAESLNSIEESKYCKMNEDYVIKIPFSRIPYSYLNIFFIPDMRIGGFGYYWSGILCLTFLLLLFLRFNNKEDKNLFLFITATVILSVSINPDAWWARYVPQLWLIPIISLIFIFISKNIKLPKFTYFIAYMCIFFIFFNSVFPIKDQLIVKNDYSYIYKKYLKLIYKQSNPNGIFIMQNKDFHSALAEETVKPHLNEMNIKMIEIKYNSNLIQDGFDCLQVIPVNEKSYFYKPVSWQDDNLGR